MTGASEPEREPLGGTHARSVVRGVVRCVVRGVVWGVVRGVVRGVDRKGQRYVYHASDEATAPEVV